MGEQLHGERRRRQRLVSTVAVTAVLLFLVGAAVVALSRDEGSDLSAASTTAATAATVTSLAPATSPATTIAATTVPPTTVAPSTAPTTSLPPIGEVLIPGFAVPIDAEDFLRILQLNPALVGERGDDLASELAKVLDGPRGRRGDRVEELRDDIERWSEDGELDPIIAAVAIHYLDELNGDDE